MRSVAAESVWRSMASAARRAACSRRSLRRAQWERKIPPAIEEAARLIAEGFKVPIAAVYPLSEIKRAVEHTLRGGKVLLDVAGG